MDDLQFYASHEKAMLFRAAQACEPLNGSLELLPLCNMDCDMCYVRLSRAEMERKGRMRTGEEWLALARQMARAGTLFLLLTGGEPLLHPDFKEIYLGLKRLGMILTINTNATLIDEHWADFFARHKPRRINVTLYGADDAAYERLCHHPGGFAQVTRAVKLLRARGVDVKLSVTAASANERDAERAYEIARELDAPLFTSAYVIPTNRERERDFAQESRMPPEDAARVNIRTLLLEKGNEAFDLYCRGAVEQIDRLAAEYADAAPQPCASGCYAGRASFAINWQGMMRPCVMTTQPEADAFALGFEQAWAQMTKDYAQVRFCAACSVCPRRHLCAVCPVSCRAETGNLADRPEYLCRYAEEIERMLRSWLAKGHF